MSEDSYPFVSGENKVIDIENILQYKLSPYMSEDSYPFISD